MIPTWNWIGERLYIVAIYGGQYYIVIAHFASFNAIVDAIMEKGQDNAVRDGSPLALITVGSIDSDAAARMIEDNLVNIVVDGD